MQHKQDLAVILRSLPYQERDRLVVGFTENHGKVTVIARNSIQSRRFGGSLDLFTAGDWHFTLKPHREIHWLQEVQVRYAYPGLRKDYDRYTLASFCNEILLKLDFEVDMSPQLFRTYTSTLKSIEILKNPEHFFALLNAFLGKILQISGNLPLFHHCSSCEVSFKEEALAHSSEMLLLSVDDGGWICQNCLNKAQTTATTSSKTWLAVPITTLLDFFTFQQTAILQVEKISTEPSIHHQKLFDFLLRFLRFHLPGFENLQTLDALKLTHKYILPLHQNLLP